MHEHIRQKYFSEQELKDAPKKTTKTTVLIMLSLLLVWVAIFLLFNKDWVQQQFSHETPKVVINKDDKTKVQQIDQADVKINIKEQELKEDLVSKSNLDYLKIKLESLFPFYEIDNLEAIKFSELVDKKFSAGKNKKFREAFKKIEDEKIKNLVAFDINYRIVDLDAKELISKALSEGGIGDNALTLLQQFYERVKGVKLDSADRQTMLAYLTQKLYWDDDLIKAINKEIKKVWTMFSSYLLIFHQENSQEYITFKEYLTQERDIVEQVLSISKLPQFDLFIDYKWGETKVEQAMIDSLIQSLHNSKLFKQAQRWEKMNKKTKETYQKAEDFIRKLEMYKEYLSILEEH